MYYFYVPSGEFIAFTFRLENLLRLRSVWRIYCYYVPSGEGDCKLCLHFEHHFFFISTAAPNLCVLEIQVPYTPWTKSVERGFSEQIAQFPVKIHTFHSSIQYSV
jgi:hypothetical protein